MYNITKDLFKINAVLKSPEKNIYHNLNKMIKQHNCLQYC